MELAILVLILMVLFQIKHFVCDYPLQIWPYMFANKGTYGHPGGILHAAIHALGTFLILPSITLALIDFVIHYHIDWAKMAYNKKMDLHPQTSGFWILLGLDQMLHQLTYILLIGLAVLA